MSVLLKATLETILSSQNLCCGVQNSTGGPKIAQCSGSESWRGLPDSASAVWRPPPTWVMGRAGSEHTWRLRWESRMRHCCSRHKIMETLGKQRPGLFQEKIFLQIKCLQSIHCKNVFNVFYFLKHFPRKKLRQTDFSLHQHSINDISTFYIFANTG